MTTLEEVTADGNEVFASDEATSGATVAGVALISTQTGRILMLQRGIDEPDDPAAGTWEFPGGHLEDGETPLDGAKREWEEEIGQKFPTDNDPLWTWMSPNGVYQGFLIPIEDEKDLDLTATRTVTNADDDYSEQAAWWKVEHARANPALREECKATPWDDLQRVASPDSEEASVASAGEFARGRRGRAWGAAVDWDPLEHPRDYRGRFIETGANVQIAGGMRGKVVKITPNRRNNSTLISVDVGGGRIGQVDSAEVTVLDADKDDLPSRPNPRTATPNPTPSVRAPRAIEPGQAVSSTGRELRVNDRVMDRRGRTGTITSVRAGIAVFREDGGDGRLRSSTHDRLTHLDEPAAPPTPEPTPEPPAPPRDRGFMDQVRDFLSGLGLNRAESRDDGPNGSRRTTNDGYVIEELENGDLAVGYREGGDYDIGPDGRGRPYSNAYARGRQNQLREQLREAGYEERPETEEDRRNRGRGTMFYLRKTFRRHRDRDGDDGDGDGDGGQNSIPPNEEPTSPRDRSIDPPNDLPNETEGPGEADGTSPVPAPSVAVNDRVRDRRGRVGVVTSVRPSGVVVFTEPDGRRRSSRIDLLTPLGPEGDANRSDSSTVVDGQGIDVSPDDPKRHDGVDAELTDWHGVNPDDPTDTRMTDEERRQLMPNDERLAAVETAVQQALRDRKDTKSQFYDNTTGTWAPERAALHDRIVNELYDQAANVPNDKRAVLTGGLPGAGTESVLRRSDIDPDQYLAVSTDRIRNEMAERNMIPNVPGLTPLEGSLLSQDEASHISWMLAQRAQADGKNVIWDSSMSSQDSARNRLQSLRDSGYNVKGVFVSVSTDRAVERSRNGWASGVSRYRDGAGQGGRFIPETVIRDAATQAQGRSRNEDTFNIMRTEMDDWELWDNMGPGPTLISSRSQSAENENDSLPRVDVTNPDTDTPSKNTDAPSIDPDPTEQGKNLVDNRQLPRDPVVMDTWQWSYAVGSPTSRTNNGAGEATRLRVTEVRGMTDDMLLQMYDRTEVLYANAPYQRGSREVPRWQMQAITRLDQNSNLLRAEINRRGLQMPQRPDGRDVDAPRQPGSITRDRDIERNRQRLTELRDYAMARSVEATDYENDVLSEDQPSPVQIRDAATNHLIAARAYETYREQMSRFDPGSTETLDAGNRAEHHRNMGRSLRAQANEIENPPTEGLTFRPPQVNREQYASWGDRADEIVASVAPSIKELIAVMKGNNPTDRERMRQQIERHYNGATVDGDIADAPGLDREGRYIMTVTGVSPSWNPNHVRFDGNIVERSTGRQVGTISRTIMTDGDGNPLEVHNDFLAIRDKSVQGLGIANSIYRRGENWFIRDGVPKVTIHADIDIGGFAWARKGFDWDTNLMDASAYLRGRAAKARLRANQEGDDGQWSRAADKLEEWSRMRTTDPGFPTPYMVSELGRDPASNRRSWPGKDLMLGTDWMATKSLVPPSGVRETETRSATDWQINSPNTPDVTERAQQSEIPSNIRNAPDVASAQREVQLELQRLGNEDTENLPILSALVNSIERNGVTRVAERLTPPMADSMYGAANGKYIHDMIQEAAGRPTTPESDPDIQRLRDRLRGLSAAGGVKDVETQKDAEEAVVTDKPFDFELGGKRYRLHQDGTVTDEEGNKIEPEEATRLASEAIDNDDTPM